MKDKLQRLVFKIRWYLMPSEFKTGSWLFFGDKEKSTQIDITNLWRKSSKKGIWFIPRIECRYEK